MTENSSTFYIRKGRTSRGQLHDQRRIWILTALYPYSFFLCFAHRSNQVLSNDPPPNHNGQPVSNYSEIWKAASTLTKGRASSAVSYLRILGTAVMLAGNSQSLAPVNLQNSPPSRISTRTAWLPVFVVCEATQNTEEGKYHQHPSN